MIKMIVSDVDGTLVGDGQGEGALDPRYFEVIHALIQKGIKFMVCSGRQRLSMAKLFRPIAGELYFAGDGGSDIFYQDRMLYAKTLPGEIVKELIQDGKQVKDCDIMVCGTKRAYCRYEDSELYRWMVDGYGYDMVAIGDSIGDIEDDIVKVSLYHKDRAEELTDPWFRPRWEDKVKLTLAGIQWLDCVPNDSGKGSAVAFMQQHYGIKPEETIVFGDNQNDMEMFAYSKRSYAVKNGREEVKQAATDLCDTYENCGVLKILEGILEEN